MTEIEEMDWDLRKVPAEWVIVNYEILATAVIMQAAKDHARSFFFMENNIFLRKLDGPALWEQIEKNYEEFGKWCRPNEFFNEFSREISFTPSAVISREKRRRYKKKKKHKEEQHDYT